MRILTTHIGSLPRPAELVTILRQHDAGGAAAAALETRARAAVDDVVRAQVAAGIDIVNDGEQVRRQALCRDRAAWSRATTRAADTGVSVTRTPKGASASSTAFAIAAGGEIAPPSPSPFTPRGLRGDGHSRCTVSISGRSSAFGTA